MGTRFCDGDTMTLSEQVEQLRCRLKYCMPCDCEPGHGCFDADLLEQTATLPARIAAMERVVEAVVEHCEGCCDLDVCPIGEAITALDEMEAHDD